MTHPGQSASAPTYLRSEQEARAAAAETRLAQQRLFFRERLSAAAEADARRVQDAARRLQGTVSPQGRVHVLYESDGALSVLFSPTLSFDGLSGVQGAAQLAAAFREVARHSLPVVLPSTRVKRYTEETLSWYPGKKHNTEGRCKWMMESLQVREESMAPFNALNRKETESIYQKCFARMFGIIKPRMRGEKGPLRYVRFTPPWLRKTIAIGKLKIILDSDSMPELRHQRNRMGERRLKSVMAAFYERERLARGVLQELLAERAAERAAEERAAVIHGPQKVPVARPGGQYAQTVPSYRAQPVSQTGTYPGGQQGSKPVMQHGEQPRMQAAVHQRAHRVQQNLQGEVEGQAPGEGQGGVQSGAQGGVQGGVQGGIHGGIQSSVQGVAQGGMPSAVRSGVQASIQGEGKNDEQDEIQGEEQVPVSGV